MELTSDKTPEQISEWLACCESPIYFLDRYGWIYDATEGAWIRFRLWREQAMTLREMVDHRQVIILKARQLGLTWLVLGFALWLMIFHPAATVLLFSRRDNEAVYLLGDERMRGMYARLPDWMRCRGELSSNDHEWILSNGSVARAFPTSAGDSYTATLAAVDEADLVPDLGKLMNAVKPTIDGGGRMVLLSRTDNSKPESEFKKIYRAAKAGVNGWKSIFLPWSVRPERDEKWYAAQKADVMARTGSLDDLHQQYPASDAEALSPRTLDKRISPEWLLQCYEEMPGAPLEKMPALPGLTIYHAPEEGHQYVIGADPAEGNPTSDESAMTVLDKQSGEEVASLAGRIQPSTFAAYMDELGQFYRQANLMVERNNHGHAVLLWLRDHSHLRRLPGWDGKEGWLSNSKGKALLYSTCADAFRDKSTRVHSFETYTQLCSIDGSSLSAPEGEHDDRADSYALALCGVQSRGVVQISENPFF
jgi:hypothetical protein